MEVVNGIEEKDYILLKNLRVELTDKVQEANGVFSLCFWLYLSSNGLSVPSAILHQEHPVTKLSVPFLLLNEKKKVVLFPLLFLHEEVSLTANLTNWREVPCISTELDLPLNKWVHVGFEVSQNVLLLHINGETAGEKSLTSSPNNDLRPGGMKRLLLPSIIGDNHGCQAYVHCAEVLPLKLPIKNHYAKDPPIQLSIDSSSASEIEEDSDGVWSIVGGKASCRRNFSLDVILMNAFGHPVHKEIEVVASLLYANNGAPVEETNDAEAPLLTSYDGIEYASSDRPSKLISGRASFKLKISQLSSKCDNRLFRIKFEIPKLSGYPFLEAISHSIRCISRNRNARTSSMSWKKSPSEVHLVNGSQSPGPNDGSSELLHNVVCEAKQSPSSKRIKLGQEKPFAMFNDALTCKKVDEECNSHACPNNEVDNVRETNFGGRPVNRGGSDNISSDSENSETTKSDPISMLSERNIISDSIVFKYCLGGQSERVHLLKEIATSVRHTELANFADQVSLFSGCSHHRHQIMIAKRLIEDGAKVWNFIAKSNHHVLWENLVSGIKEHFTSMVSCTRSLTFQVSLSLSLSLSLSDKVVI
ncbi:hypothetical protein M9H77_21581 [Catharanthus roseus]|uniref:Uncharacterized protein n=1 Tax=Catharanthus roseus TaxID=4058 RepID=A0ACC0AS39_CATRO|nr:hypothetical protein M9H77_21581 [Catharanthus roseus]